MRAVLGLRDPEKVSEFIYKTFKEPAQKHRVVETIWSEPCLKGVMEISCLEVWREISNYIDNDIGAELRARMEAHFLKCSHCKAILDGTRNVIKLIGDGIEYRMPEGFSERLLNRIRAR